MAARTPWANPESTWRIYSALAAVAGVRRPVRVDDPRVLVGRVASGGSETVVLVNCSDDRVTLQPSSGDGEQPAHAYPLTLEPFGVATLPLAELVLPGSASSGGTALLSALTEGGMPSSEPQSTR